jgi:single-stranded DNA-binding protein
MPFVITGMGVGTVHRDSKLYTTREGRVVTNLTLYCKKSDGANKPSGEEDFLWITAEFWGDDAGYICSNVGKGSRLMVMGNCYMNSWRDKVTGENRSGLKVRTKSYEVLEARAPLGNDNSESQYRQRLNGDDEDESESGKIPF